MPAIIQLVLLFLAPWAIVAVARVVLLRLWREPQPAARSRAELEVRRAGIIVPLSVLAFALVESAVAFVGLFEEVASHQAEDKSTALSAGISDIINTLVLRNSLAAAIALIAVVILAVVLRAKRQRSLNVMVPSSPNA